MKYSYLCAYFVQSSSNATVGAYIITSAQSKLEALGYAHEFIYKEFPTNEGWYNHNTTINLIPDETIEMIYNELLERKK